MGAPPHIAPAISGGIMAPMSPPAMGSAMPWATFTNSSLNLFVVFILHPSYPVVVIEAALGTLHGLHQSGYLC